jgi:hypothetical protein
MGTKMKIPSFGIYSVFGESVREGGCSPSLKTLKNLIKTLIPETLSTCEQICVRDEYLI